MSQFIRKQSILGMISKDAEKTGALGIVCRANLDSFFDESRLVKRGWIIHEIDTIKNYYWRERYAFKDNGASILAVAHCDTVFDGTYPYKFDHTDFKVVSPELDDRLGVYIITSLLPRLGVKCDVLLTENEEFCSSTASDFATEKKYNWIMEWDRRGSGAVLYQYDTPELRNILSKFDFKISEGTYSDICVMYELGVAAINFATGYANEHTQRCFADLRCLSKQVVKFLNFYNEYKDVRLESKAGPRYATRYSSGYGSMYDYDDDARGGYYDKDGKWHYYGSSATSGTITSTNAYYKLRDKLEYQLCVNCGDKSKVKTTYKVRGMYICPSCEYLCKSCGYHYPLKHMDNGTGFCLRCKAIWDALTLPDEAHHVCAVCKKNAGCTEVWENAWVCHECLYRAFVVCDYCGGVMPANVVSTSRLAAVGICKICADKKHESVYGQRCDGCNKYFDARYLTWFTGDQLRLCDDCSYAMYGTTVTEGSDDGPSYEEPTTSGYGPCDICGERGNLYDNNGLRICKLCNTRLNSPGL